MPVERFAVLRFRCFTANAHLQSDVGGQCTRTDQIHSSGYHSLDGHFVCRAQRESSPAWLRYLNARDPEIPGGLCFRPHLLSKGPVRSNPGFGGGGVLASATWIRCPTTFDCKRQLSRRHLLANSDIDQKNRDKKPVKRFAPLKVCRFLTNAHLQSGQLDSEYDFSICEERGKWRR
jgi:hypothetical protein